MSPLSTLHVLTRRSPRAGRQMPSGQTKSRSSTQEASMFFIVEITPDGAETFLDGFEDVVEAWEVAHRLQLEAQEYGLRVRYDVR
jgi:hypothetical protein